MFDKIGLSKTNDTDHLVLNTWLFHFAHLNITNYYFIPKGCLNCQLPEQHYNGITCTYKSLHNYLNQLPY
jgi:hypothetical protein